MENKKQDVKTPHFDILQQKIDENNKLVSQISINHEIPELKSKIKNIEEDNKESLELQKESLEIQKDQLDIQKDREYQERIDKRKEKLKKGMALGKKTYDGTKNLVKGTIDKVKDVGATGILAGLAKLVGTALLIKSFWPVITKTLWPLIVNTLVPYIKGVFTDTIIPYIKENFITVIKSLGIAAIILKPISTLKLVVNSLLSITKLVAKGVIGLTKSIFSSSIGGEMGGMKTPKNFKGMLKMLKPLARIIPFLGILWLAYDLLESFFPQFMENIKSMFSIDKILELGSTIWNKVQDGISGIGTWIVDKVEGVVSSIRNAFASYIDMTWGKIPFLSPYVSKLTNFIRGDESKVDLETSEDKKNKMENSGIVETKGMLGFKNKYIDFDKLESGLKDGSVTEEDLLAVKKHTKLNTEDTKKLDKILLNIKSKPEATTDTVSTLIEKDNKVLEDINKRIQNLNNSNIDEKIKTAQLNSLNNAKSTVQKRIDNNIAKESTSTSTSTFNNESTTASSLGVVSDESSTISSTNKNDTPVKVKEDKSRYTVPTSGVGNVQGSISSKPDDVFKFGSSQAKSGFKDLNPDVQHNITGMGKEYYQTYGEPLQLNSTARTISHQTRLYNAMLKKNGGRSDGSVATPGGSMHNYGLAVDAQSQQLNNAEKSGIMDKWGFHRNVYMKNNKLETWHMEPKGIDRNAVRSQGKAAMANGENVDDMSKAGTFTKGSVKKLDADGLSLNSNSNEITKMATTSEQVKNQESKPEDLGEQPKVGIDDVTAGLDNLANETLFQTQNIMADLGLSGSSIIGLGEADKLSKGIFTSPANSTEFDKVSDGIDDVANAGLNQTQSIMSDIGINGSSITNLGEASKQKSQNKNVSFDKKESPKEINKIPNKDISINSDTKKLAQKVNTVKTPEPVVVTNTNTIKETQSTPEKEITIDSVKYNEGGFMLLGNTI